jgi:hypothetical protein
MKKSVLLLLAVLACGATAEAQVPAKPNMFPTLASCNAALLSGHVRFYEPKYFGLTTRNPVNNADRVVVPLETDLCLEMLVVGGRQFVAQREGTLFRALKRADGSLALYARDDCGNPVYNVILSAPVLLTPEVRESQEPVRHYVPSPPPQFLGPPIRKPAPVPVTPDKKGGFCSSTKCRFAVLAVAGGAGYAAWRYWPCPPGTARK